MIILLKKKTQDKLLQLFSVGMDTILAGILLNIENAIIGNDQ